MSQFRTFDLPTSGYCEVCRDERNMRQFAIQLPTWEYHYLGMKCTECGNFSVEAADRTGLDFWKSSECAVEQVKLRHVPRREND